MTVAENEQIFDDMLDVAAFVEVAAQASFSKAAIRLREPRATVSRRIARLEERAGAKLFERTTRSVQITSPGELLLEHARRIVEETKRARLSMEALTGAPSGRLRITAPFILGQALLGPVIDGFMDRYPDCAPFLDLTNNRVDLVEDGYDIALRLGPLAPSSLIARRVGAVEAALYCASGSKEPVFADASEPADLENAPLLRLDGSDARARTLLLSDAAGREETVRFVPRLISTEPTTLLDAILSGKGIGMLPTFIGNPLVASGTVVRVLPGWAGRRNDVYVVTTSTRLMRPAVRAFVDFAAPWLAKSLSA